MAVGQCVVDEHVEDLADGGGADLDPREVWFEIHLDSASGSGDAWLPTVCGLAEQGCERPRFARLLGVAGEGEQVISGLFQAIDISERIVEELGIMAVSGLLGLEAEPE